MINAFKTKDRRLPNKYKRYCRLLMIPKNQLQSTIYKYYQLFDWIMNTIGIVDYLLTSSSELKVTCAVVHHLREALEDLRIDQFKQGKLLLNIPLIKIIKSILRSFKRYNTSIQSTFIDPTLTNRPIEGLNNNIKVLKQNACGYHNNAHFKDRMLLMIRCTYHINHPTLLLPNYLSSIKSIQLFTRLF